jgi:hypothetical protein
MSQVQPDKYRFKKFDHSSMSATTITNNIELPDYKVYDICNNGDTLDYIVARYLPTNQIQVITIKLGVTTYIKNLAKSVTHPSLISETISAKCTKSGEFKDKAVYEVAVVGSFYSDTTPDLYDLYIGRFSTRANFTTNFYKSTTNTTNEIPKTVYIDVENERIYAVVDINTNKYYHSTVYEPGEEPGTDNPNIAIMAMSFDFGTRLWVAVLGDSTNIDYFGGLSMYKGFLHVVTTSHTDTYSTDESQSDIIYTKIDSNNGRVSAKKVFGSATDDKALDIQASTAGIYIMALIGDNFNPHPTPGSVWQTYGGAGKTNFAMLLVRDSDSQLVDIEGYDLSAMADPYPKRFSLQLYTGTRQFIFYSPRTNTDVAGLYISKFTGSSKVFINDVGGFCTDSTN